MEPPVDLAIAELARRQHGVVGLRQLAALGLGASAVHKRARTGRLHRVHRGVYAVGHARLTGSGRSMAAVASHRTAADLHGLRQNSRAIDDVTVPAASARSRRGVVAHASPTLRGVEVTTRDGIPCTSVARTLLDLAEVVPRRQLERAVDQAAVLRVFDLRAIDDLLAGANGRRGASVLGSVLAAARDEPGLSASELEERLLALCRAAGLPLPEVNAWLTVDGEPPIRPDLLWRRERLIVELDGWTVHGTRAVFERDRRRDQRAQVAGWVVLRFTWRQLQREPDRVVAAIAAVLDSGAR